MNATAQAEQRTQEGFNRLPLLLSRAEYLWWSGLSGAELDEEVRMGRIPVRQRPAEPGRRRYRKYFKWNLAEVARLKV
jgi:hypothetical protein